MLQWVNAPARHGPARHGTEPVEVVITRSASGRVGRMFRTATHAPVLRAPDPDAGAVMAADAQTPLTGGGGMLAAARLVLEAAAWHRAQGLARQLVAA